MNASRGGVVCNRSLTTALLQGKVRGAVIDCWENEPNIDRELLELVDIATPHIAGYSADGKWTATKMSIENLIRFFALDVEPEYAKIPIPNNPIIDLQSVPVENQLQYSVWHTYHPQRETEALKESPEQFYRFRSEYPLRREYPAFTVRYADEQLVPLLQKLGFNIE